MELIVYITKEFRFIVIQWGQGSWVVCIVCSDEHIDRNRKSTDTDQNKNRIYIFSSVFGFKKMLTGFQSNSVQSPDHIYPNTTSDHEKPNLSKNRHNQTEYIYSIQPSVIKRKF